MSRHYFYQCAEGHEYSVQGPASPWDESPDVTACPDCGLRQSWHAARYLLDPGKSDANLLHQSGERCENRYDQAFVNVKNRVRAAGEHSMRTADQWTEKERRGYETRKRLAEEKGRSLSRRQDSDMRMVGEVPARLNRKMIQESGDPQYWTRDNCANMKRHGLYWGKR